MVVLLLPRECYKARLYKRTGKRAGMKAKPFPGEEEERALPCRVDSVGLDLLSLTPTPKTKKQNKNSNSRQAHAHHPHPPRGAPGRAVVPLDEGAGRTHPGAGLLFAFFVVVVDLFSLRPGKKTHVSLRLPFSRATSNPKNAQVREMPFHELMVKYGGDMAAAWAAAGGVVASAPAPPSPQESEATAAAASLPSAPAAPRPPLPPHLRAAAAAAFAASPSNPPPRKRVMIAAEPREPREGEREREGGGGRAP